MLAQTFAKLHLEQPQVITYLYNLLFDTDARVRQAAAEALGQLERAEPHVLRRLLQLLTDNTFAARQAAIIALGKIGIDQPEVIDGLLKCLFDSNHNLRSDALTALGQVTSGQAPVIDALLRVIVIENTALARQAAEILASLPIDRTAITKQLDQLLQHYAPTTTNPSHPTAPSTTYFSPSNKWLIDHPPSCRCGLAPHNEPHHHLAPHPPSSPLSAYLHAINKLQPLGTHYQL